ncbi:PRC-barrel domain-containing protein [Thalassococcus sp. BH17M4-6]|uniref:PRC-barrel domain-containing protein n=1 Tax=Thalassococcus sp. BH17M4-6 TaxID=3413148 RepID=UPI003BF52EF8
MAQTTDSITEDTQAPAAESESTGGSDMSTDQTTTEESGSEDSDSDMSTDDSSTDGSDDMATEEPMADDGASDTATEEPMADEGTSDMATEEPMDGEAGSTMAPEAETTDVPTDIASMTVGDILGQNVMGVEDESVGEIDYVIDDGGVVSFVIGVGGFLGLGEYTVAIPADQFSLDEEGRLTLGSMTKSDLEAQPEFDESTAENLPEDMTIGSLM